MARAAELKKQIKELQRQLERAEEVEACDHRYEYVGGYLFSYYRCSKCGDMLHDN